MSAEAESRSLVQLDTRSTTFNTTLNLTGPIILGMTIASASLLYAYYAAFPRKKSSGYNKGYSKRSVDDDVLTDYDTKEDVLEKVYETFELLQNLEDSLTLIGINTRDCQLRAVCDIVQDRLPVPQVDTVTQVIKMTVSRIKKINLDLVQSLLRP